MEILWKRNVAEAHGANVTDCQVVGATQTEMATDEITAGCSDKQCPVHRAGVGN